MGGDIAPLDVSVVIPAYNRADMVAEAVGSALTQTPRPPLEVIVVDDASTDDTAQRAEHAGARVIRLDRNGGAGRARNEGAGATRGRWLWFLDSDDALSPGALDALYWARERFFLVGGLGVIQEDDRPDRVQGTLRSDLEVITTPARIVFPGNPFPASGCLVARDAFERAGGYNTTLRYGEDMDLWIRVLEQGPACLVSEPVVVYRRHPGSKSQDASALRDRIAIVEAYRERAWFSERLLERYTGVLHWLTFRDQWRAGRRTAALSTLGAAVMTPTRVMAVTQVIARHLAMRVRKDASQVGSAPGPPS